MKNILRNLLSVSTAGFLLLLAAFLLAFATIVEHIHGINAARFLVYNSKILEAVLLLLSAAILYSFFKFKLYRPSKITIGIFHLSFIVIVMGAAATRYFGEEGLMHIREGEQTQYYSSTDKWFFVNLPHATPSLVYEQPLLLSQFSKGAISTTVNIENRAIRIKSQEYIHNALPVLKPDTNGEPLLELVFARGEQMQSKILRQGDRYTIDGLVVSFGSAGDLQFYQTNNNLKLIANDTVRAISMGDNRAITLQPDSLFEAQTRLLYKIGETVFIVKNHLAAGIVEVAGSSDMATGTNALKVNFSTESAQQVVTLWENESGMEEPTTVKLGDIVLQAKIGTRKTQLPFTVQLKDFHLERYPGSHSPSSYESTVQLIDNEMGINREEHIYMNNIMKHRGYRFYQSSYDNDEQGTILAVNRDRLGTNITYLGYLLLFAGILLSIFHPQSYFVKLMKKAAKPVAVFLLVTLGSSPLFARDEVIPDGLANSFSKVWVQGSDGRLKPFTTFAYETVMKISRSERLMGQSPEQVVLGMTVWPDYWQSQPIIAVSDNQLRELLNISGSKASYNDFFNREGQYKLAKAVDEAYHKSAAARGTFDNAVIKTDERLNVAYLIYKGDLLKIFPSTDKDNHHWATPPTSNNTESGNSTTTPPLFGNLIQAAGTQNHTEALRLSDEIIQYQQTYGVELIPKGIKQKLEIFYYRFNAIKYLSIVYLLAGLAAVTLFFASLFKQREASKKSMQPLTLLFIAGFTLHTATLAIRGYISGHMPWSNGYESMIYVAWAGMLAGLLLARKNVMVMGAAAILSGLTLFVAQMSWLNPEITQLVPVLKSYWLTFHVAIITASYGFVGVCAIIGLLNLLMAALSSSERKEVVSQNIRHLTIVSEAAMILGLYFLTIGTFLGAIWANESWGRYWGWDPKETWSLVTILLYGFITHMRLIPGFRGWFAFNLASVIGLLSVIMTYLGVNYYLSGLHSYGSGSGLSLPLIMLALLSVIAFLAFMAWRKSHLLIDNIEMKETL